MIHVVSLWQPRSPDRGTSLPEVVRIANGSLLQFEVLPLVTDQD